MMKRTKPMDVMWSGRRSSTSSLTSQDNRLRQLPLVKLVNIARIDSISKPVINDGLPPSQTKLLFDIEGKTIETTMETADVGVLVKWKMNEVMSPCPSVQSSSNKRRADEDVYYPNRKKTKENVIVISDSEEELEIKQEVDCDVVSVDYDEETRNGESPGVAGYRSVVKKLQEKQRQIRVRVCPKCNKAFVGSKSLMLLERHSYNCHSNDVSHHVCPLCQQGFKSAELLGLHVSSRQCVRLIDRNNTSEQKMTKLSAVDNCKMATNEIESMKSYSCSKCGLEFTGRLSSQQYVAHKRSNNCAEKTTRCFACNKSFTRSYTYWMHRNSIGCKQMRQSLKESQTAKNNSDGMITTKVSTRSQSGVTALANGNVNAFETSSASRDNPGSISESQDDKTERNLCDFCDKTFANPANKKRHMMLVHKKRFSSSQSNSRDSIASHASLSGLRFTKTYKCKVCDKFFIGRSRLLIHLEKEHCTVVTEYLPFVSPSERKLSTEHKTPAGRPKNLPAESDIQKTSDDSTDEISVKVKCKKCPRIYTGPCAKQRMEQHKQFHLSKMSNSCPVCKAVFSAPSGVRFHLKKIHGRKSIQKVATDSAKCLKFKWPCLSNKDSKSGKKVREDSHGGSVLRCSKCPRVYSGVSAKIRLKKHVTSHSLSAYKTCEICGVLIANLSKHMSTVHGQAQVMAKKSFRKHVTDTVSSSSHSKKANSVSSSEDEDDIVNCTRCKIRFCGANAQKLLKKHRKNLLTRVACKFCRKSFTTECNLHLHLRRAHNVSGDEPVVKIEIDESADVSNVSRGEKTSPKKSAKRRSGKSSDSLQSATSKVNHSKGETDLKKCKVKEDKDPTLRIGPKSVMLSQKTTDKKQTKVRTTINSSFSSTICDQAAKEFNSTRTEKRSRSTSKESGRLNGDTQEESKKTNDDRNSCDAASGVGTSEAFDDDGGNIGDDNNDDVASNHSATSVSSNEQDLACVHTSDVDEGGCDVVEVAMDSDHSASSVCSDEMDSNASNDESEDVGEDATIAEHSASSVCSEEIDASLSSVLVKQSQSNAEHSASSVCSEEIDASLSSLLVTQSQSIAVDASGNIDVKLEIEEAKFTIEGQVSVQLVNGDGEEDFVANAPVVVDVKSLCDNSTVNTGGAQNTEQDTMVHDTDEIVPDSPVLPIITDVQTCCDTVTLYIEAESSIGEVLRYDITGDMSDNVLHNPASTVIILKKSPSGAKTLNTEVEPSAEIDEADVESDCDLHHEVDNAASAVLSDVRSLCDQSALISGAEDKVHNSAVDQVSASTENEMHGSSESKLYDSTANNVHDSSAVKVHDSTESNLHDSTDDKVHDTTESNLHDSTDDKVHDTTESNLHDSTDAKVHDTTESKLHDSTDDKVHDTTESKLHDSTDDKVHDTTESKLHDCANTNVQDSTDSKLHDRTDNKMYDGTVVKTLDSTEDKVNDSTEDKVHDSAEDRVHDSTEDKIHNSADDMVRESAESKLDDSTDYNVHYSAEDKVYGRTEDKVCDSAEDQVYDIKEDDLKDSAEEVVHDNAEGTLLNSPEPLLQNVTVCITENTVSPIEDVNFVCDNSNLDVKSAHNTTKDSASDSAEDRMHSIEQNFMSSIKIEDQSFPHNAIASTVEDNMCNEVKTVVRSKANVAKHKSKKTVSELLHSCKICANVFPSFAELVVHKRDMHKKFLCKLCNTDYSTREQLREHRLKHGGKRHICDTCSRWFLTSQFLAAHRRIHDQVRKYKCGNCQKRFLEKGQLLTHSKTHWKTTGFPCEICGHRFREKGQLETHLKAYDGQPHVFRRGFRKFVCTACRKRFFEESQLKQHWKSFTENDSMKITQRIKSEVNDRTDSSLQCTTCLRNFNTQRLLYNHLLHTPCGHLSSISDSNASEINVNK